MKAISNGISFSRVRHCTQGSLANVVMPEKIASAVTENCSVSSQSQQSEKRYLLRLSYRMDLWGVSQRIDVLENILHEQAQRTHRLQRKQR
jgi:hypothetical protein